MKKSIKKCTCPKTCDCQNPPPDNWNGEGGVYHTSLSCPVHYRNPKPDEDCPVHKLWDGKEPIAVWQPEGSYSSGR